MTKGQKRDLKKLIIAAILMVALAIVFRFVEAPVWVELICYLVPYLIIGLDTLKSAGQGILNRQIFDEEFLMVVATIGAFALGEHLEGVAVMLFFQVGELFEHVAIGRSRKNISQLMDIRPDYANMMVDGQLEQVDPDEVAVGSVIIVKPGEKIPIDGRIVEGHTSLDTRALTGESVPRDVNVGMEVISGCINMTGMIKVETTKEFGESTVSKILDLVENSSMKKARTENFITRFARYYTPAVCFGALALAVLPPIIRIIMGLDPMWQNWIIRGLTFLVISCPCALVISIPLSFFAGIGCASSNGILVKGSNYLEMLGRTKYIVFDKTGTLTKGVFQVTGIEPATNTDISKEDLLRYAAYAESASSHPISLSLKEAFGSEVDQRLVTDIEEIAGHGVKAVVEGHQVLAGNAKLMDLKQVTDTCPGEHSEYVSVCANEQVREEHLAQTIVHVAVDGVYAGYISIADVLKPTAKAAIAGLKAEGIKQTVMLTGDAKKVADKVAEELDIDQVYSELLPGDKVEEVEKLLAAKEPKEWLAFVGDGINDAPVLTRADVGIAMGGLGSDAAIEAADIVLMDDDPAKISLAMKIARKVVGIAVANIVFALVIKAICLVLGAMGIGGMWLAIFADVGVLIIAVLNATRALKIKI